jgi:magnesium chelatase family protein
MLASIATFAIEGIDSREVTVEVDVRRGLPAFTLVGLPDAAVREARERVRAALLNSGLEFPLQRLTANLAPARMRKAGAGFDLALAVALLAASEQVPPDWFSSCAVCGELSLSGALRRVHGTVAIAAGARRAGYERLIVPVENAAEAALVDGIEIVGVPSLTRLVDLVQGRWRPDRLCPRRDPRAADRTGPDLAEVRGQQDARRALEIAAAGGHSLLMVGPPGAGKTMLARRLPGILPVPTFDEAVEITRIHSIAGLSDGRLATERPFRAPHHTISASGLIGGGSTPRPGEITLAHRGVLFLDELPEFSRPALEALRQPLEAGHVEIVRGQRSIGFPAAVMLVGACNACPCARPKGLCDCREDARARYQRRLSGPLIDRIDLVCQLEPTRPLELVAEAGGCEGSAAVRERVAVARERQRRRLAGSAALCNGSMDARLTRRHVPLDTRLRARMLEGHAGADMSGRGHDRVLRLARTIADLGGRERIAPADIDEAVGYRMSGAWRAAA